MLSYMMQLAGRSYQAGRVTSLRGGQVSLDLHGGERVRAPRTCEIMKAPAPTLLTKGAPVRIPYYEDVAPGEETRWFYGRISSTHPSQLLVSVELDNGEGAEDIPMWEVFSLD